MIYLDSSVALAQLLVEDRHPPDSLWRQGLISSRLLEYEMWTRVNGKGFTRSHGEQLRELLGQVSLVELAPPVLARALDPFPTAVRTLDALHLATIEFLRAHGQAITLASYDQRLNTAATALGIPLFDLADSST